MAVFPDEAAGEAALEAELTGPYSKHTIDGAIAARTPNDIEGNDTTQTQDNVHSISRLPGDAIIGQLNPEEKQRLYNAIRRSEGWRAGSVGHDGLEN